MQFFPECMDLWKMVSADNTNEKLIFALPFVELGRPLSFSEDATKADWDM